jgi:serine/threonine protein kinase
VGYIIFPWAAGGNLQEFWEASEQEASPKLIFWSLQQMLGLTSAVHQLHEKFNCRHGDLKPGNILCVRQGEEIVLKIADFGVSRIHHAQTTYRKGKGTISVLLTPSYQGPEVEIEEVDKNDPLPRSRKYDIWSLGCVFLEFTIWLLHGPKAIEGFTNARGNGLSSTNPSYPLYEVTSKSPKLAQVHKLVSWTIDKLEQDDPRCHGDTALAALLSLIKKKMLQIKVDQRPTAADICTQLEIIIHKAQTCPSYLLPPCDGKIIPRLDFKEFHLDANQETRP